MEGEWISLQDAVQEVYRRKLRGSDTLKGSDGAALREESGLQDLPLVDRRTMAEAQRCIAEAIENKELQWFHDRINKDDPNSIDGRRKVGKLTSSEALQAMCVLPLREKGRPLSKLAREDKFFKKKPFDDWIERKFPYEEEQPETGFEHVIAFTNLLKARKALLERMGREGLTKEQGEAIAHEENIGPLELVPNSKDFDPRHEPVWSMTMVIAWIMFRDLDRVCWCWPDCCEECRILICESQENSADKSGPEMRLKYQLQAPTPFDVATLSGFVNSGKPGFITYERASKLLQNACISNKMLATGFDRQADATKEIPAGAWRAGQVAFYENRNTHKPALVIGAGPEREFIDIQFSSQEVLSQWPIITERDRIIDQISRGNMTPDQGEFEAQKKGLTLCPSNPPPSTFAPLSEPTWTLPMVLAWIMFRTPEDVTQHCEKYTRRCFEWRSEGSGYYLAHLRDPSTVRMAIKEARSPTSKETINNAKDKLKAALLSGELSAFGRVTGQQAVVPIPKLQWGGLDFLYDKNWRDVAGNMQSRERYENLSFEAAKVQALWPVQGQETEPETSDEDGPAKDAQGESVPGKGKRGRKPTSYDGFIEEHAEVFSKNGAYGENHPLFTSPGDVKAALERWFEKKNKDTGKPVPQKSSLYRYVKALCERFKQ